MQLSLKTLSFDAFTSEAPFESAEWAASDRGWAYDPAHPDADRCYEGNLPIGNYLRYPTHANHAGKVHVVLTPWYVDSLGHIRRGANRAAWCDDVETAQQWLRDAYAEVASRMNTQRG